MIILGRIVSNISIYHIIVVLLRDIDLQRLQQSGTVKNIVGES